MKRISRRVVDSVIVGFVALCAGACSVEANDVEETVGTVSQDLVVGGFSAFGEIPNGTFTSGPAITARSPSSLDIYARGGGSVIFKNSWTSALGWTGWSPVPGGGTFATKPTATTTSDGTQQFIAARGWDGKIYVKPWQSGAVGWGAWSTAGASTFDSAPALAFMTNTLYLFARKPDLSVYWSKNVISAGYNPANWTPFTAIPNGSVLSDPAAAWDGNNLVVAARGGGDFFYTTKLVGGVWQPWSQIPGGTFKHAPALSSWGSGHLDVFGTGMDDRIYFNSREANGAFIGYQAIPNATFTSGPTAWSSMGNPNRIRLAAKGGNNAAFLSSYAQ